MNANLLSELMELLSTTITANANLYETRCKAWGKADTISSFGEHVGRRLNQLYEDAIDLDGAESVHVLEAAIALVTSVYLDLDEHHASIQMHPDKTFVITSEGEEWIAGTTDGYTA